MIKSTPIDAWQWAFSELAERIGKAVVNVGVGQVVRLLITVLEESA